MKVRLRQRRSRWLTPQDRIVKEFEDYLRTERGLAPRSIVSHLLTVRRFLQEACLTADDLGKIGQETVIGYIERHARDWSPSAGWAMCSSLRAFLRYLHHRGLNPRMLAGCVPSIRRWKHATLPTYLLATQVQKVLDGCDRTTATGRRDYGILMILAKLAAQVTTLTLDDIDWRAGEIQVCCKGGKRARMPIPPDVGAAVVAYLRNGRPKSSCRRLFVRTRAPMSALRLTVRSLGSPKALLIEPASQVVDTEERIFSVAAWPLSFYAPAQP